MKTLICTLVLLLLLGGVALADRVDSPRPTASVTTGTVLNKAAPPPAAEREKVAPPATVGESLLTIIKVRIDFWFGINLFGDPAGPDSPQLDDGRHLNIKDYVPIRDSGFEEQR